MSKVRRGLFELVRRQVFRQSANLHFWPFQWAFIENTGKAQPQ